MMIAHGAKVQFDPFKEMTGFASEDNRGKPVIGTIIFVHYLNKWFSVEYERRGVKQRASFKFSQIGKDVVICGH